MGGRGGRQQVVGRDGEIELLQRALARAAEGQPGIVLVTDDPGIGKSTLLYEAARRAGTPVYLGRCVHVGGDAIPLAPLVDLIRQVQRGSDMSASCPPSRRSARWRHPARDAGVTCSR
jgi:predicted ATPase